MGRGLKDSLLGLFFRRCGRPELEEAVRGARDGREWILRLLGHPTASRAFREVVALVHRRWWSGKGGDGFLTPEDSLHTAVLELLDRVAPRLDLNRTAPELLHECLLWAYHAVTRSIARERVLQEARERPREDPDGGRQEDPLLNIPAPEPDGGPAVPERPRWQKPSISRLIFAAWRQGPCG